MDLDDILDDERDDDYNDKYTNYNLSNELDERNINNDTRILVE